MKSRTVQISVLLFLLFFSSLALSDQIAWPVKGDDFDVVVIADPITDYRILPFTEKIENSVQGEAVSLTAAPDSYEPASFVIRSGDIYLKDLRIELSDLKAETGKRTGQPQLVFPKEDIDIKAVKCWYQAGSAGSGISQHKESRVLIPELLLNDDSLVKVDLQKKENYLKLSFPAREKYVWISDPKDVKKPVIPRADQFPVKDSPRLLPLDIPPRTNKQFWLTVHVPKGTSPGTYGGTIDILSANGFRKSLTLKLRILPFRLLPPYYASSIFYRARIDPIFDPSGKGTISSEYKTEQQFRAELKDLYDHGVTNPLVYEGFNKEVFAKVLQIREEAGMGGQPLYYVGLGRNGTGNPSTQADLETLREKVRAIVDLCRSYGIPEVYFFGIDEATGQTLSSQRRAWDAVHEAGGKVFSTGFRKTNFEAMGDIQDVLISAYAPSADEAKKWHSKGHQIWSYANPQGGVEAPQLYRRNFGLLLWRNGYDGAATYAYQNSYGNIWNDFDHPVHRDIAFAYPTVDGVIDTVEWEGYREGVTDVRYVTTLMDRIEKAKKSGDKRRQELAAEASRYLDGLEIINGDLLKIRTGITDYILRLDSVN